ncbi:expressed unknown protein [Seminavis robusta]|uniref:Uncharacterized protein n=1 Tax=Seminavis robusta TaxID=568900 RepID=A0A9N8H569_9STRA|nr:expressed unknown protein [Seminavis robusta]|eukprot:Sro134_g063570.1 n/a (333) ;mRNA; f:86584-87582
MSKKGRSAEKKKQKKQNAKEEDDVKNKKKEDDGSKLKRKEQELRARRLKVTPRQFLGHLFLLGIAFGVILLGMYLQQPIVWAPGTKGGLRGELPIDTMEQAHAFADMSITEADKLWDEPSSNWRTIYDNQQPLSVECRSVTQGPYELSSVLVARAKGAIRASSADQVYEFLSSPEGLSLILNAMGQSNNRTYQTIETIPEWREGASTEIAEITLPGLGPILSDRHLVVQTSRIPEDRILVTKSVLHKSRPGASSFYKRNVESSSSNSVRAVTSFAIKVNEETTLKNGQDVVEIRFISYVNLFLTEGIMSYISCQWLFPSVFQKLQERFEGQQ